MLTTWLLACGSPEGDDSKAPNPTDTGRPDTPSTEDSPTRETDSGDTTDETGDTDTEPTETDSPPDTDTAPPEPVSLVLETDADAKLVGEEAGDAGGLEAEMAVAGAGDVDADGYDDVLVGMSQNSRGGTSTSGAAYLVRGPFSGTIDLSGADAILTGTERDYAGMSVGGAGDVNADGYADLIVGAPYDAGDDLAYVVFGPVTGERSLADADAFLWGGNDGTGLYVAGMGDMDGDGWPEVGVAAVGNDTAYVLSAPFSGDVYLGSEAAMEVSTWATSVAAAGDTDGDGLADALFSGGAEDDDCALLFLGPPAGAMTAADADTIFFDFSTRNSCWHPTSAGDTDGDGYSDIVFDSITDSNGGYAAGAVSIASGPFADRDDITVAPKLTGPEYSRAGYGISAAGDVDADGFDDIVVGGPMIGAEYTWTGSGGAWVCLGPFSGTTDLADCHGTLTGSDEDLAGASVAGVGDTDGDGIPDLLIGGPGDEDGGGAAAGAAWLVTGATLLGR